MYKEDKAWNLKWRLVLCRIFSSIICTKHYSFSALYKCMSVERLGGNVWRTHHMAFLNGPQETQCCKCTVRNFQTNYFPHAVSCLKHELQDLTVPCGFGSMRCLSAVSLFKGNSKQLWCLFGPIPN